MIRTIAHTHTRAWHRTHTKRYRETWAIMIGVLAFAVTLFIRGYFESVDWLILGDAVLHTTYRLAIAYGIALVLAVSIALLVGWSSFADTLFPVFDMLQNIPSFALIPFFIYFLGYSDQMIILFAVTSITWPILFAILAAIKGAHTDLNDAASIFGARGLRRVTAYLAPLSFPSILTGSIVGVAIGWEAVIGAELITNIVGFGGFIKTASATGISQTALAGMLAILLIVFIINRLIWAPLLAESSKRYAE